MSRHKLFLKGGMGSIEGTTRQGSKGRRDEEGLGRKGGGGGGGGGGQSAFCSKILACCSNVLTKPWHDKPVVYSELVLCLLQYIHCQCIHQQPY